MTTTPTPGSTPAAGRPTVGVATPTATAAAVYFALQAVAGVVLWIGVAVSDQVRSWLELVPARPEVTDAFFPADVVVIVSSALAAWALWRARPWALVPVWCTVGGVVYPTVYLGAWVASTEGSGDVALGIMVVTSALSCGAAVLVWRAGRHAGGGERSGS
ncbi:MAG: hypothetical protein MUF83_17620 [Acidimicrobiales bacterium]|nr:hypothetical protein [Acidimicrobiales bacterium]